MAENLTNVAVIAQPEPLFTIRPRYVENLRRGDGRGVRASFKLVEKTSTRFKTSNSAISESIRKQLLGDKGTAPFTSFLITQMSYQFTEKIQLSQVFGDHTVAFAFGASPIILNITGVVTDDLDNDWFTKFIFLYKDYMRGSQLARNFELGRLSTHNATYDGAIMSLSMSHDSTNDTLVSFNMQFLVRAFEFYSAQEYRADDLISAEEMARNLQDNEFSVRSLSDLKNSARASSLVEELMDSKAVNELTLAGVKVSDYASVNNANTAAATAAVNGEFNNSSTATISPGTINGDEGSVELGNNSARITASSAVKSGSITKAFEALYSLGDKAQQEFLNWKVVGLYSDGLQSINSGVDSIGGFLDELKRNLETFNSKLSNLPDPFASLADTIANARKQVDTMTDIVNLVKESALLLTQKRDLFSGVNDELAALQNSVRNLKGAISSFSTTSSQNVVARLSATPYREENIPFLGNRKLGIGKRDALAILMASMYPEVPTTNDRLGQLKSKIVNDSLVVPNLDSIYSPTYTSADSNLLVFV